MCKNPEATLLFEDVSMAFDSIQSGEMEQILVYDFLKETITVIMMLYKKMKATVCSSDGDTDYLALFL